MYISQFGNYTFPSTTYEQSETQGFTKRRDTTVLGGSGSFDNHGSSPDPLAEDTINYSFTFVCASRSALHTAMQDFIAEMDISAAAPMQGARLLIFTLYDDSTKWCTWAKCVELRWTRAYYHENMWWQPVQVTFYRTAPKIWAYDDLNVVGDHLGTLAEIAVAGLTFGGNLTEESVTNSPHTFTITVSGKAVVTMGIIEYDGPITTPALYNLTVGHSLIYSGSALETGDRVTVDVRNYDARRNGVRGEWDNFTIGTKNGQILPMVLYPGSNSMKIVSASAACTFRFYWPNMYTAG